jgi:hypothetical protein
MISHHLPRIHAALISGALLLRDALLFSAFINEGGHRCVTGASLPGHQRKNFDFFENFLIDS